MTNTTRDGLDRVLDVAHGEAADSVDQRRAEREAEARVDRAKSFDVGAYVVRIRVGVASGVGEIISGLRADNERADLIVVADISPAKNPGVAEPLVPRSDVNDRAVPGVAALQRGVEAGPRDRRHDRNGRQRRSLPGRKICGYGGSADQHRGACHGSSEASKQRYVHRPTPAKNPSRSVVP